MTFSPTSRQVVLEEIFDENSTPDDEEIREYALRIGVDVENEPHLLPLARDCLMQPLPPDWKPCRDPDRPDVTYYFNFKLGRAQWTHPLDEVHRALIRKACEPISSVDEDSRTTVKEDLKSYEEAPKSDSQRSDMIPKSQRLEPLAPLQRSGVKKPTAALAPLKPFPLGSPPARPEERKGPVDKVEVKMRPNSSDIRNRRNTGPIELRHLSKQEIITPRSTWRDEGYATESVSTEGRRAAAVGEGRKGGEVGKELSLMGGGTMFLRKGSKKMEPEESPKGILRKDSLGDGEVEEKPPFPAKLLFPPRFVPLEPLSLLIESRAPSEFKVVPTVAETAAPDNLAVVVHNAEDTKFTNKDDIEDDRKSVSFKFEKELKVHFETPVGTDSEDQSSRPSSRAAGQKKEIELDFEDLNIYASDLKVPDDNGKTAEITPNVRTKEDASSRNYKKSINIVLNGNGDNKNENLIDLTDGESVSTIDSHRTEVGRKIRDVPKSLDLVLSPKKMVVDLERKLENPVLQKTKKLDDLWRMSDSDNSSQSGDKLVHSGEVEVEKVKINLEAARADKLKELEGDFNAWVQRTEKLFKDKEKQHYGHMKEKYDDWKKNKENELIKDMSERWAEESQSKMKELRNELLKEEQEAVERLRSELAAQQKERLRLLRLEVEGREEQELAGLKQSMEASLSERKEELYRKHQEEMGRLDRSMETLLAEQRAQQQLELEKARKEESALHAMTAELKDTFLQQKTILQQEHEMALQKLRQQQEVELRQVASSLRVHTEDATRKAQVVEKESSDPRVYEKLRCEKRLLEDKYKSLKEKYIRLKTDVKLTLEKKTKRKEAALLSASETDKSASHKTNKGENDSPNVRRKADIKIKKQATNLDNVNQNVSNGSGIRTPRRGDAEDSSGEDEDVISARRRRQLFSKLKAASTSRLTSSSRMHDKEDALSPVENLRRQLKKLEELEDEFPVTTHTDTYLRYPFTDAPAPQFACSEIEFFKHRIHLERDSVRRAKEFLKTQKKCYEKRQLELQHRLLDGGPASKSILDQIHKEERELTEMEVSVHRTRALLGEKIIRLRHLEQSLRRVAPERRPRTVSREDGTLSDLSSHSDSSGFSSTHHTSEPFVVGSRPSIEQNRRHLQTSMQESSEIIQSLENLNTEIRGIWEVLKQQSTGPGAVLLPPPPLAWPAVRANPTADTHLRPLTQQIMTQVSAVSNVGHVTTTVVDSSLVDRTRSLRDWLKSARRSPNLGDTSVSHQVTL